MRKLLNLLVTTALVVGSIIFVAVIVQVRSSKLDLAPVLSGSMRPTFSPGDLVVSKRVSTSSVKIGDIVAFVPPGKHEKYMHRVRQLWRSGDRIMITTKGDSNSVPDPWGRIVIKDPVVYKEITVIPKIGWATTIPRGYLMLVFLVPAGLVFIISGIKSFRGKDSSGQQHQHKEGLTNA